MADFQLDPDQLDFLNQKPAQDPAIPQIDPAQLEAQRQADLAQKRQMLAVGSIGDALASQNSAGNYALGHLNSPSTMGRENAQAMIGQMGDPYSRAKSLLDAYRAQKGEERSQKEFDYNQNLRDQSAATSGPLVEGKRTFAKSLIAGLQKQGMFGDPQTGAKLQASIDQMNPQQIDAVMEAPLLKSAAESARTSQMLAGLNLRERGLNQRGDEQAARAANRIHNDNIIKSQTQQLQLGDRAIGMLQKPDMTMQEFNDVQQEISNMIAGAKSSAIGKLERTEYDTLEGRYANALQKLTGDPQAAVPGPIRQRLLSLAQELQQSVAQHREDRAKSVGSVTYKHNPDANDEIQDAVKQYASPYGKSGQSAGKVSDPADQQAIAWLKANPNDPHADAVRTKLKAKGAL